MRTLLATLLLVLGATLPPSAAEADALLLRELRIPGVALPQDLLIVAGEIRALAASGTLQTNGATVIDGSGFWAVPGLADMHVHLERFEDPVVLGQFLAAGVTTVRSMGGGEQVLAWRQEVLDGDRLGPHILVGSPIIEGRNSYWADSLEAGTAGEGRRLARELIRRRTAFLKIYHTLPATAFVAIAREAERAGIPLVGHVPDTVRLAAALAVGMRSLEHLRGYGGAISDRRAARRAAPWQLDYLAVPLDPERLATAVSATREAGAWNCPTLVQRAQVAAASAVAERWARVDVGMVPPAIREEWDPANWRPGTRRLLAAPATAELARIGRENRQRLVRALAAAGAPLLSGSDTPSPFISPGTGLLEELAALEAAGLDREAVLAAATREPGRFVATQPGGEAPFGRLAPGNRADILLLAGDPADDLAHLATPVGLVVRGRWLDAEALAALREAARARYAGFDIETRSGTMSP